MKILVLQLARFGDIYQTWPALNGLKRVYPEAEITLLVREKFLQATEGLSSFVKIVSFETSHMLSPIIFEASGEAEAARRLDTFISTHHGQYDQIINLTFSPFSSYLTDALATESTRIRGYTRTTDGHLQIPDDASAYFYAQAGVMRKNRIHLTDLFGMVSNVTIEPQDFNANLVSQADQSPQDSIVVQIGASTTNKTLSAVQWTKILQSLNRKTKSTIYLVGSREDRGIPVSLSGLSNVNDIRGSTSLRATMALISQARLVVAPDSVTVHMASLAKVRVLQYSIGPVRFWETGPRTLGSRVVCVDETSSDVVLIEEAERMMDALPPLAPTYEATSDSGVIYSGQYEQKDAVEVFSWELIKALYMDNTYPEIQENRTYLAFLRLSELVELGLEQLLYVRRPQSREIAFKILNEVDTLMDQVSELDIRIRPVVNWFLTQKVRIGPGPFENVLQQTEAIFKDLQMILKVYNPGIQWNADISKDMTWKP